MVIGPCFGSEPDGSQRLIESELGPDLRPRDGRVRIPTVLGEALMHDRTLFLGDPQFGWVGGSGLCRFWSSPDLTDTPDLR